MGDISKAYENYVETVFQVGIDLTFWNHFLKTSVEKFQQENIDTREIFSSLFAAYDIDLNSNSELLKIHEKSKSISSKDLEKYREDFFSWVINGGIVKVYIAVETVLIQTIWDVDFSCHADPALRKKNGDSIQREIRKKLKKSTKSNETKNNRHLIEYLSLNSIDYQTFLSRPIRVDLNTTWAEFYELFSILRNIFSHIGSKLDDDILNEIRSKAKDIFERHFIVIKGSQGEKHLFAVPEQVGNLLDLVNDFTLNTVKIIRNESDFEFLKMKKTY